MIQRWSTKMDVWQYTGRENRTICSLPPCLQRCLLQLTLPCTVLLLFASSKQTGEDFAWCLLLLLEQLITFRLD